MNTKSSHAVKLIETYDPLANFLRNKLYLTPVSLGIILLVINLLVDAWLGWHFNVFTSETEIPGLLQDWTALTADLLSIPLVGGLYLWTIEGATKLFRELYDGHIVRPDQALVDTVNQSRPYFKSKIVFILILLISTIYAFSQLGAYLGWLPWATVGGYLQLEPVMSWARAPFWLIGFYQMVYGMFNIIVTVVTLQRIFYGREIQLLPLHPDRCGGLVSISQYSVKIGIGIAVLGLMVSMAAVFELQNGTLLTAYPILIAIVFYIFLAPVFFFLPMGTAHEAMQEAKDAEQYRLAEQFDAVYDRVKQEDITQDPQYEKDMQRLEHLRKLYDLTQKFPVWPFNSTNLRRFLAIILAPVIPTLFSLLQKALENILFGS